MSEVEIKIGFDINVLTCRLKGDLLESALPAKTALSINGEPVEVPALISLWLCDVAQEVHNQNCEQLNEPQ